MAKRKRGKHTNEQKAEKLRQHRMDKVPVSRLRDEYPIQPSVFSGWRRQILDNLPVALEPTSGKRDRKAASRKRELAEKVEALEARLAKKEHVIAEISEEYDALKGELGAL